MSKRFAIFAVILTLLVVAGVVFGAADTVLAQANQLEGVGEAAGLSDEDPRLIVARIIRIALGLLGLIVLVIIIYAGVLWMTAGGNPEKVEKAKKFLINAVIGLLIIVGAFAITQFVFSSLEEAGLIEGERTGISGGASGFGLGGGSVASFTVSGFRPTGEVEIRNVEVQVTFTRNVDPPTVEGAVTVENTDTGTAVAGDLSVDGNKVTFEPSAACPEPNEDRNCFDADANFAVTVSTAVRSTAGDALNCVLASCSETFTTGAIIDVEDPDVNIDLPQSGERFELGSFVDVRAQATDDSQVGTGDFLVDGDLFDSVPASGEDLSDVTLESIWDSVGFEGGDRYRITVEATDIAGNSATDSVSVHLNPAHCDNGRIDEDDGELGVDCGGECGACNGTACESNDECASGLCLEGSCATVPQITSISPPDGAPGTYVTVSGKDFGSLAGVVSFTATDGTPVEAQIPACADGWSDTEVVVEVPQDAADGPVTVTTSAGLTDATNDDIGPLIDDFDVNTLERPLLCNLSPGSGRSGTDADLIGANFGDVQEDSVVMFDADAVTTYNGWTDGSVDVRVPALTARAYDVTVTVDGTQSNALSYELLERAAFDGSDGVADGDEETVPSISFVTPENGGIGQYITIVGSNFGDLTGTVWFENPTLGYAGIGSTDFPPVCTEDFWSDDEITVIVPEDYSNDEPVDTTTHTLYIVRQDGAQSDPVDFQITTASPTPGICALSPNSGQAGDEIAIRGDRFGSDDGTVIFFDGIELTDVNQWTSNEILVDVPDQAATGPLSIFSAGQEGSNEVTFEVTEEDADGEVATVPRDSAYAWRFSTGEIPETPGLIIACNENTISGVPNQQFTNNVCVNANVFGEFTLQMDHDSFIDGETVLIEECQNDACSVVSPVTGEVLLSDSAASTSFTWKPTSNYNNGAFLTDTEYRVTLTTGVLGANGIPLDNEVSWEFTTGSSDQDCEVAEVRVSPSEETLTAQGETTEFNALAATQDCQVLNSAAFGWGWEVNSSYASIATGVCEDIQTENCAVVTALAEGETDVTATEDQSGISGSGELTIDFTDPYVLNEWPACQMACINADVGGSFNIAMDAATVEREGAAMLQKCTNELCFTLVETVATSVDCTLSADTGACTGFTFGQIGGLDTDGFYKATLSSSMLSASGVPLSRLNEGSDYTWTFRTKTENAECVIARLELDPDEKELKAIGQRQSYQLEAFGDPDSCSVAGQRVNTFDYDWDWEDPIVEDEDVAEWVKLSGGLFDADKLNIPNGCTDSCLAAGSTSVEAVCGNGTVEIGEDCDDGNAQDGDGCSSTCLHEGAPTCSFECSNTGESCVQDEDCFGADGLQGQCEIVAGSCCGDGVIETAGSIFEECDDGNIENGDGCSAQCLREGSRSVGAVCGNGSVGQNVDGSGEECDDGNKSSGDGCSAQCLNEGSQPFVDINAVCGNGTIETPFETCDDGNLVNGDGCSDECVREGHGLAGAQCGNGTTEQDPATGAGEDCDGEEGCSNGCLWEGSSIGYSKPSVCGDGIAGIGEIAMCESGVAGDGRPDPVQLAEIVEEAAGQVDVDEQRATTTIRVSQSTFGVSAESSLHLSCVAETDEDCPAGFGPANNSCCMPRPEPAIFPNGTDICRNASIFAEFDTRMNPASFNENAWLMLDVSTVADQACPDSHEILTADDLGIAKANASWFARAWQTIKSWLLPKSSAQEAGDCVVPITGFSQHQEGIEGDEVYRVAFRYGVPLEPNAAYTVVLNGDELGDVDPDTERALAEGILTNSGVAMDGDREGSFTTGVDFCTLDHVQVRDTDPESPRVFNAFEETHMMQARAVSFSKGIKQYIEPIAGVYEWEWLNWMEDSAGEIITLPQTSVGLDAVDATATNESGEATILAQAQIIADEVAGSIDEDTGEGPVVGGEIEVQTFICTNPWPAYGPDFPFGDDTYHFETFYCRDSGEEGPGEDLPDVTVVSSVQPPTSDIQVEYFLKVNDGSGESIGIRVASNPDYLSPMEWFNAQNFTGSPTEIEVDGFEAVQAGRTAYVSAPNVTADNEIYPNMYVISHSQDASNTTLNIYNQILENFSLATNLSVGLCHDGSRYTSRACSSDLDCQIQEGEICGNYKAKIQRDVKRLSDLKQIQRSVFNFGRNNRFCSQTSTQSCTSSVECPGSEQCLPSVPRLISGTFIPSRVTSAWTSWDDTFSAEIGEALPKDPLNVFDRCEEFPGFDENTCVDQTAGVYKCRPGSFIYQYKSNGPFNFEIATDLEYLGGAWAAPLDTDPNDNTTLRAGSGISNDLIIPALPFVPQTSAGFESNPICRSQEEGTSNECGDGIIGKDEKCEIGETGNAASAECTLEDGSTVPGTVSQICNDTCSGFVENPEAVCVPNSCGNGVIDGAEECDDGTFNGRYGFCGSDCTYDNTFVCGDGSLASGEVCDCGDDATGRDFGGTVCTVANGVYSTNPNNTCARDCSGPAEYCGDGVVQQGEQCDGDTDTYAGTLCSEGIRTGLPCEVSEDCPLPGTEQFGSCGGASWANECPTTTVCLGGDRDALWCITDNQCPGGGICSQSEFPTTRTRSCFDDGASGEACTWNKDDWATIKCRAEITCGNGVVEDGEECDDGNDNTNDNCTNECTVNVCGDGYLLPDVEQCDEGAENGMLCSAPYGETCSYCSSSCRVVTTSGLFCGDGVRNGGEYCDGENIPYKFINPDTSDILGDCFAFQEGQTTRDDNGVEYVCSNVGWCNGGDRNGGLCTTNAQCDGGGECVKPQCANDCRSACPVTGNLETVEMQSADPGAPRVTAIELSSFRSGQGAVEADAATMHIPRCRAARSLTGNINFNFEGEEQAINILFLLDRTTQMKEPVFSSFSVSRMKVALEFMKDATSEIFSRARGDVRIGVGHFYGNQNNTTAEIDSGAECGVLEMCPPDREAELRSFIDTLEYKPRNWRKNVSEIIELATSELEFFEENVTPSSRNIVIILSDGSWIPAEYNPDDALEEMKKAGIEVFTGAVTDKNFPIFRMNGWSGANTKFAGCVDYSHDATGNAGLSTATNELVKSTGTFIEYVFGNETQCTSLREGSNTNIGLPAGFSCDPNTAQEIPFRFQFFSEGGGTISMNNLRLNHCTP